MSSWLRGAWRWVRTLRSGPDERMARREGLLFYMIVLAVLAGLAANALVTSLRLSSPGRLAAFGTLMLVHVYLHWRSPLLALRPGLALPYLVLQGGLASAILVVSWSPTLAIGLFPVLVGVTAGTIRDRRLGVLAAVAYLVLGLWVVSGLLGWRDFLRDAPLMILPALLAVFFAISYRRLGDTRDEVQSLVGELTGARDRLAEYAVRVEGLTVAAERQRMARELHDTLAQGLAGLILQLEAATGQLADAHTERASAILQHALVRARETLSEARQAIGGLRETGPARDDLVSAIHGEAGRFTRQSGVPCRLDLRDLTAVETEACPQVHRIVAEALGNVARHARAGAVTVASACDGDGLLLTVEDDGVGFDVTGEMRHQGHYGILGMRERASLLGGSLRVDSSAGRGTRVGLRLPRRRPAADE